MGTPAFAGVMGFARRPVSARLTVSARRPRGVEQEASTRRVHAFDGRAFLAAQGLCGGSAEPPHPRPGGQRPPDPRIMCVALSGSGCAGGGVTRPITVGLAPMGWRRICSPSPGLGALGAINPPGCDRLAPPVISVLRGAQQGMGAFAGATGWRLGRGDGWDGVDRSSSRAWLSTRPPSTGSQGFDRPRGCEAANRTGPRPAAPEPATTPRPRCG